MSGAEFFNPSEGGESYDPAAFERFKEQVKKNGAAQAAAQKSEQKQKQKEDRLAKILLKFIQTNQHSVILLLAAKLLAQNVPASFILSLIMLGHEEVASEVKKEMALNAPSAGSFSVIPYLNDDSIPLKMKAEIDEWARHIFEAASGVPYRILETTVYADGKIKREAIDCAAHVLQSYIQANQSQLPPFEIFVSFCEFLMESMLKNIRQQILNQKELT